MKSLLIALSFALLASTTYAEEAALPTSHRSNFEDRFWVSLNGGMDPFGNNLAPVAFRTDFTARFQINRFVGILVNYHDTWVDTMPRHGSATARNRIAGVGYAIRAWEFGKNSRFWHSSYLLTRAQLQKAQSKFRFSAQGTTLSEGTQTVLGVDAGADLYVPIYFGAWFNLGVGLESNNFAYSTVSEPGGDTLSLPSTLPYMRLGFSYSF